jgi:hypothetical protein
MRPGGRVVVIELRLSEDGAREFTPFFDLKQDADAKRPRTHLRRILYLVTGYGTPILEKRADQLD